MPPERPLAVATPRPSSLAELLAPLDTPYTDDVALARMRRLAKLYEHCRLNPRAAEAVIRLTDRSYWAWLALISWTADSKGARLPVKPFAPLACYKILADWADERTSEGLWARPLIAIDKSRQMMMSWWAILRLYWLAQQTRHGDYPVLSKGEDDANLLIVRLKVSHRLLPAWYRKAKGLDSVVHNTAEMRFPSTGSVIASLPQRGGDAFRSRVPSAWLADEAAFQSDFEANYQAATGTSDARTQGIMITTAAPSHFDLLIHDRLDGRQGGVESVYHSSQGLTLWRNRINKIDCARIFFFADPGKRSPTFRADNHPQMSEHQWQAEFMINYVSRGGKLVFPMLDRAVHVTLGKITVYPAVLPGGRGMEWRMRIAGRNDPYGQPVVSRVRLLRAIDHGTSGFGACVWIAVDEDFDWFVYRTYKVTGRIASQHAAAIARLSWHDAGACYERYQVDGIDAMMSAQAFQGKVEQIYRDYVDERGARPLAGIQAVRKPPRQMGLDRICQMLYSTRLAVEGPDAEYWTAEGIEPFQFQTMLEHSSLYLGLDACEPLFDEMQAARYDEPSSADPDATRPETTVKMKDDALDCVRYMLDLGAHLVRQRRGVTLAGAR
jgi:hypothetical protein